MNVPRPDREAGIGLVEVLVAIVLLGLGVVGIMGAYGGVIKLSALHRNQASTTNALTIAAEAVASPAVAYQPCAGADPSTGAYRTAIDAALSQATNSQGVTFTVTYWSGTRFPPGEPCHDNDGQVPAMQRIQLITFSSVVPTQTNPWTLTIVKRAA